jgi:hypothetical protein
MNQDQTTKLSPIQPALPAYLLIGIPALLLRVLDLGRFLNSDEINFWIDRSHTFLRAIQSGDFAATAISTHPGVTTMWAGSAGVLLRRMLFEQGILTEETFPILLTLMRVPVVFVHVVGILLGYALLRRLFSPSVALLAGLLWATDPFITAFNRILHVDGLTGTFATVSILAACWYWNHHSPPQRRRQWGWLVVSGASGALALLSKSPGLAVVPIVSALAVLLAWEQVFSPATETSGDISPLTTRLWRSIAPLLLWGGIFALTIVLVFPAMWADPMRVYDLLRVGVEVEGGTRHVIVNYFLGQQDPVPGPLYYPVVLAIRLTPWGLIGMLLLPLAIWRTRRVVVYTSVPDQADQRAVWRDLAVLASFSILFIVAMSFFEKKLDRYLVVIFPMVTILSGYGLVQAGSWLLGRLIQHREQAALGMHMRMGIVAFVGLIAVGNAAYWHPYGVSYFNQALGGIQMGVQTVLIGEGEGLGDAARWLNAQPDITGVTVTSTMIHTLQAFLRNGAQAVSAEDGNLNDATGYVLIYIRHMQRWGSDPPPPYDQFLHKIAPVHVVKVHGVDYARIYQVPPHVAKPVQVDFGSAIQLYGYTLDTTDIRATGVMSLTVAWKAQEVITKPYMLFVHVLNDQGEPVAKVDVPPAGLDYPIEAWQVNRYIKWVHPIPLPADLPNGRYWVALGIYDQADFARLPVSIASPSDAPDDGGNVVFLEPVWVQ